MGCILAGEGGDMRESGPAMSYAASLPAKNLTMSIDLSGRQKKNFTRQPRG